MPERVQMHAGQSRPLSELLDAPQDVAGFEGACRIGREHQPGALPEAARGELLCGLALAVLS